MSNHIGPGAFVGDAVCILDGCGKRQRPYGKGLCGGHYARVQRYGSPTGGARPPHIQPIERFLEQVNKTDGCWFWTGPLNNKGYPLFGGRGYAHRWSYRQHVGPIPEGLELDHLCRTPRCVNPLHLEPVTHAENQRRMGLAQPRQEKCKRGHDLSLARVTKDGRRDCRLCKRDRERSVKA